MNLMLFNSRKLTLGLAFSVFSLADSKNFSSKSAFLVEKKDEP